MDMPTHVFIDTSAFIADGFRFEGPIISRLLQLSDSNEAKIVLTEITVAEVESRIRMCVRDSLTALKKCRKEAHFLRNLNRPELAGLFGEKIDEPKLQEQMLEQFGRFLKLSGAVILGLHGESAAEVFRRYFHEEPPFNPPHKKAEFPDAFVLDALSRWAKSNSCCIYIVSSDCDFQRYCESSSNLLPLDSITVFLDIVSKNKAKYESLISSLDSSMDKIEAALNSAFGELDFYVADWNGEVLSVSIYDTEILERSVIKHEGINASVYMRVRVYFEVEVEYEDLATAAYDSEDGLLYPWNTVRAHLDESQEIVGTLEVYDIQDDSLDNCQFRFEIDGLNSIAILVDPSERNWPHK